MIKKSTLLNAQTVRMEQCHAPELPCNYIDPLLKSACLQVVFVPNPLALESESENQPVFRSRLCSGRTAFKTVSGIRNSIMIFFNI